jgi:hypothetical protein
MDSGAKILLGIGAFYVGSVLLTYVITKLRANKQLEGYKSLMSAVAGEEEKLATRRSDLAAKEFEVAEVEAKFKKVDEQTKELQKLVGREKTLKDSIELLMRKSAAVQTMITQLKEKEEVGKGAVNEVITTLDLYNRIEGFIDHGHFEIPEYLHETSERFTIEIKIVRDAQKGLIRGKEAVVYPAITVVSNDPQTNKKVLGGQAKLMLAAFNIECDTLIGKVKPSTFQATLERIDKLATRLEKSSGSLACGFNADYIKLKFDECRLQYQFT